MRAAIIKPTRLASSLAPMFGTRPPVPIMSVILEQGERSVERRIVEATANTREVYLVSVHTAADYEAAHRKCEESEFPDPLGGWA